MPNFWGLQRRRGTTSTAGSAAVEVAQDLRPVELYTGAALIHARVIRNSERLLDIVNREDSIRVRGIQLIPYYSDVEATRTPDWTSLDLSDVLMLAPPEHESPRQLRIHRRQRRVELQVPPFIVIGNAHMAPGYALNDFLRRQTQPFIPITVALLRHNDNGTFDRSVPVVLVNRARVTGIRDLLA